MGNPKLAKPYERNVWDLGLVTRETKLKVER